MDICVSYDIIFSSLGTVGSNPQGAIREIVHEIISPHGEFGIDYGFYPKLFFNQTDEVSQTSLQGFHRLNRGCSLDVNNWKYITFRKVNNVLEVVKLLGRVLIGTIVVISPHDEAVFFGLFVVLIILGVFVDTSGRTNDHELNRIFRFLLVLNHIPLDVPIILGHINSERWATEFGIRGTAAGCSQYQNC